MGRRARARREKELEGVNLLGLAPRLLADWEEVGGKIVVLRPRPRGGGMSGFLERLFYRLSTRRIRLDEVGSFAWSRFDGTRTVGEVAGLLRERFGESVEPAEERLGKLVWVMRQEGLLGYPGWDD